MSRNTKIILGILAALIVICACVAVIMVIVGQQVSKVAKEAIVNDPAKVAEVADKIATYTAPPGYTQTAMSILGFDMILLTPPDSQPDNMIILMQFPASANLSREEMEKQMQQSVNQQFKTGDFQMNVVDQTETLIRGETTTLTTSEGTNSNGVTIRQVTGVFRGNNGTALVAIMAPADRWNQDQVDAFLRSIH
jgi:uncharacterized membrane protein